MRLTILDGEYGIARLEAEAPIPEWCARGPVLSLTRTPDELSIVCAAEHIPPGVRTSGGWRCLRVEGPLDFSLTGVLLSIAEPLARAGVSVFAISTFDTDYVLVPAKNLATAAGCLRDSGHQIQA